MGRPLIDVSSWQHASGAVIDWAAVAASGVAGVIIKATQGASYANPYFAGDLEAAETAGLLVGAYHFAEPSSNTFEAEAAWCNDHTAGLALPLGLWLDLEVMAAGGGYPTNTWAEGWLTALALPARKVGVYMNQSFTEATLPLADTWPLWQVTLPGQTQSHDPVIVQTSESDTIPGITGLVDLDELVSTRWVNPAGPNPPAPPTPVLEEEPMIVAVLEGSPDVLLVNGREIPLTQAELEEAVALGAVIKRFSPDLYHKVVAAMPAPPDPT